MFHELVLKSRNLATILKNPEESGKKKRGNNIRNKKKRRTRTKNFQVIRLSSVFDVNIHPFSSPPDALNL